MKEEIISFETAKIANGKGFNHVESNNKAYQLPEGTLIDAIHGNITLGYVLAPTQSLLQRWFREVHNIDIHPSFNLGIKEDGGWSLCVTLLDYTAHALTVLIFNRFEYMHFEEERTFHTYEEALEVGLQEALKLIKSET